MLVSDPHNTNQGLDYISTPRDNGASAVSKTHFSSPTEGGGGRGTRPCMVHGLVVKNLDRLTSSSGDPWGLVVTKEARAFPDAQKTGDFSIRINIFIGIHIY